MDQDYLKTKAIYVQEKQLQAGQVIKYTVLESAMTNLLLESIMISSGIIIKHTRLNKKGKGVNTNKSDLIQTNNHFQLLVFTKI